MIIGTNHLFQVKSCHFFRPKEQQSAIESYLGVHAFPTYKLFDRDGNQLDLNVDARDLDDLLHTHIGVIAFILGCVCVHTYVCF